MFPQDQLDYVLAVKARHETELLKIPNVVGVGVGVRYKEGQSTGELSLVVNVTKKQPAQNLLQDDLIPTELDGVPVDVQEVGYMKAM